MFEWTALQKLGITMVLLGATSCAWLTFGSAETLFFWYYGEQTGSDIGWGWRFWIDGAQRDFATAGVAGVCCIAGMYLSRHIKGAWFFRIIGSAAVAYWAVSLGYIAFGSTFH